MTYSLASNHNTPTDYHTEAVSKVRGAAKALREVAQDLDLYGQAELVQMEQHGPRYAADASVQTTLLQRVQAATLDMARAQKILLDAVALNFQAGTKIEETS